MRVYLCAGCEVIVYGLGGGGCVVASGVRAVAVVYVCVLSGTA